MPASGSIARAAEKAAIIALAVGKLKLASRFTTGFCRYTGSGRGEWVRVRTRKVADEIS